MFSDNVKELTMDSVVAHGTIMYARHLGESCELSSEGGSCTQSVEWYPPTRVVRTNRPDNITIPRVRRKSRFVANVQVEHSVRCTRSVKVYFLTVRISFVCELVKTVTLNELPRPTIRNGKLQEHSYSPNVQHGTVTKGVVSRSDNRVRATAKTRIRETSANRDGMTIYHSLTATEREERLLRKNINYCIIYGYVNDGHLHRRTLTKISLIDICICNM